MLDPTTLRSYFDALPAADQLVLALRCGLDGLEIHEGVELTRGLETNKARAEARLARAVGRLRAALGTEGGVTDETTDNEVIEGLIVGEIRRKATAHTEATQEGTGRESAPAQPPAVSGRQEQEIPA